MSAVKKLFINPAKVAGVSALFVGVALAPWIIAPWIISFLTLSTLTKVVFSLASFALTSIALMSSPKMSPKIFFRGLFYSLISLGMLAAIPMGLSFTKALLLAANISLFIPFVEPQVMSFFKSFKSSLPAYFKPQVHDKVDFVKSEQRTKLIATLLMHPQEDVAKIKANFKELFALRSSANFSHEYLNRLFNAYSTHVKAFMNMIKLQTDWDKPENQVSRRRLMIEAIVFTDAVLARIEKDIREAGLQVTTNEISKRLTNQEFRTEGTAYFWYFMYRGVIDFYNVLRQKTHIENDRYVSEPGYKGDSFYQVGSEDNAMLKLYNTFIKHGLEKPYGGKENLRKQLLKDDQRLEHWTRKDSMKTKNFRTFPDTRPT
jgi:hypothetical protein